MPRFSFEYPTRSQSSSMFPEKTHHVPLRFKAIILLLYISCSGMYSCDMGKQLFTASLLSMELELELEINLVYILIFRFKSWTYAFAYRKIVCLVCLLLRGWQHKQVSRFNFYYLLQYPSVDLSIWLITSQSFNTIFKYAVNIWLGF